VSPDPLEGFFDREEVLAGLPARRADALLFVIESRTAHLVARSRRAMEPFITEETLQAREIAFLEAFALGRDPPLSPTIQDLERHAPEWADLVANNPRVQAAVAHRLGEKYQFTREAVPGVRAALGLDDVDVREAYGRLYREPLEAIFADRPGIADRVRWWWSALAKRLENLPPFWTAYSLTLTEAVGSTILALPIALAAVGPLPGVAILVVVGLVNVLTVAFMAEAISRSGTMRYGSAFYGRLVADYLGRGGSVVVTMSLFLLCVLVLPICYIGFAGTLEDATSVPAAFWVAILFAVGLHYVRRESLNSTIASALLAGAVNIGLIVALSVLAFAHAKPGNLLYEQVPFVDGRLFESSAVALVFGVVLAAYFGHMSVGLCGQLVLRRDPGGRSLTRGCAAAQGTAILLYCLFVLAVNGAVAPQTLAHETGTALAPLARTVGPVVHVLGSAFATLALGMVSITLTLALFSIVVERLPSLAPVVVALPRRAARLRFEERGRSRAGDGLHVGLVYLGLDGGQPRFRVDAERAGSTRRFEATATGRLEVLGADGGAGVLERFPDAGDGGGRVALDIADADEQSVRVHVTSNLRLAYEGGWDVAGLSLGAVLALAGSEPELVGWMTRRGEVSLDEIAQHTGGDADAARARLSSLLERGVAVETGRTGEPRYVARAAARRGRRLPAGIWEALAAGEAARPPPGPSDPTLGRAHHVWRILLGRSGRFAMGAAPVFAAFLAAEWMVLTHSGSFAGLLNFVGVLVITILAGVFPVLLLVSSRRKGEHVPAAVHRALGNPVLLGAIYLVFVASVFLHGLVIWDDPFMRAAAVLAGAGMLAMTAAILRRGALAPRVTLELREVDGDDASTFAVTAAGRPVVSDVRLEYPDGERRLRAAGGDVPAFRSLRRATFDVRPDGGAQAVVGELKVWVHGVTADHDSEAIAARLEVRVGPETHRFALELSRGQIVLPLTEPSWTVDIALAGAADEGSTPDPVTDDSFRGGTH
jgi:amino acid permease